MSKRTLLIILLSFVVALILSSGAASWFIYARLSQPFQGFSKQARILMVGGNSAADVAVMLEEAGVITSARVFRWYVRYRGEDYFLQAGEYRFDRPLSILEVAGRIHRGKVHRYKVTLPEGLSVEEITERLEAEGFGRAEQYRRLASFPDLISDLDSEAEDLEGYLFPETYFFTLDMDEDGILKALTDRFRAAWNTERQDLAAQLGLSLRETISLASLIEKETALASERPLISAVFHNRLERKMKLECDPTVIYAVSRIKKYDGIIHQSDLDLDSPYNTYKYPGLPPGPIASPGADSIDAALRPASVPYLYFVARNDGSHFFSSNYRDHHRAVLEHQRR